IPAGKRGKNADIKRILDKEGEQMLAAAGKNRIVTLDIPGKPWAGAGNTVQSADDPGSAPVYPRWRGEYAGVPAFRKPVFGLSPL
ncbi:hypothetical protein MJL48_33970, partial [Salmonella enterica subsp. enterica serovar Kentucky]|nr:hypothetical protein [Salmonella enterica subsp. enterica serovar Kentucky]